MAKTVTAMLIGIALTRSVDGCASTSPDVRFRGECGALPARIASADQMIE